MQDVCRDISKDLRFAFGQFQKSRGFAAVAVFVMALGICATVAIFGFVDATLIKPLPYRDQARLVGVFEASAAEARGSTSLLDFRDWQRLNKVFRSIDAYGGSGGWSYTLSTRAGAQHVLGMHVTSGFFQTLGVTPILGRAFRPGEDSPAAPETVLLSYGAWQKRFGGRRDVLGRTVRLDGSTGTIIGVLPKDFNFAPAGSAEFWGTQRGTRGCEQDRGCSSVMTVARLKDGVSRQTALADMRSVVGELQRQYPTLDRDRSANVLPLKEVMVGDVRPILLMLLSGAGLLLLIACINVASLLLARSDSRKREIAVRNALGASAARLFRQFATEAVVLAAMGCACGLLLADWGMRFLTTLIPADMMQSMPYLEGLGMNFRVTAFAAAISLAAALVFALTPTLRLSLSEMMAGLKEGSRGSAGTTWRSFGKNLVAVELALAVVLLVSAGLLGKSLYRLLQVDIGINPDHLATLQVEPPAEYSTDEQFKGLARQVVERAVHLPGVQAAAVADQLPGASWGGDSEFGVVGHPRAKWTAEQEDALQRRVSTGYFAAVQARLLEGHFFSEAEARSKRQIVVINQSFARRFFAGQDPIGQQIFYVLDPKQRMQIVGVAADLKEGSLDTLARPAVYFPFDQNPNDRFLVVVRTRQAAESLLPVLTRMIHRIEPGISIYDEATMRERIDRSPTAYLHRSAAWLVGSFAGIALLLGVVGLYGVIAYSVSQRTREIGVRMALGAQPAMVYQLILGEAVWLAAIGIAMGFVCSLAAAALIRRMLFGVQAWDVATLACVAVVLGGAALLASYLPARRAAGVNPLEALRAE